MYVPGTAVRSTINSKVDSPVPLLGGVISEGMNPAVTPNGTPLTLRETGELKPLRDATVMVEFP